MELLKRIKKNNLILEHWVYIDHNGFKRDSFEIVKTDKTGYRTRIPFLPSIKVMKSRKDSNLMDLTVKYTNDDYREMINRFKL